MKLIESSVQIIEEKDPYKMIELAGRTCYKSENNITEDSAKEFVDRMIKLGHGAMLEHGTIYLTIAKTAMNIGDPIFYVRNKYSKVNEDDLFYYITTNMRVIVENNRLDDLQYQVEPTEHHEKRITAKFICDRGVSHEFVRHRVFSFAQESQRYCNYSKDKFNNEIKELESSDAIKISENSRQMQLNTKTDIMKVLTALKNYAQSKKETFDFVILSAAQFYSGFNKPDVSSINIVFKSRAEEKVVKIKDVIALLNGSERERDNFFYLYHKSSSGNMNKEEIFREIIKAFVC